MTENWEKKYMITTITGKTFYTNYNGWECFCEHHPIITVWDSKDFNHPGLDLTFQSIETVRDISND